MLEIGATHAAHRCTWSETTGWTVLDGGRYARGSTQRIAGQAWSTQLLARRRPWICASFRRRDRGAADAYDQFLPHQQESMVLAFVEREGSHRAYVALRCPGSGLPALGSA